MQNKICKWTIPNSQMRGGGMTAEKGAVWGQQWAERDTMSQWKWLTATHNVSETITSNNNTL